MNYQIVTSPAVEPVSLQETLEHLRIDEDQDNELVAGYITAAREFVEGQTLRQLITTTLRAAIDEFPANCRRWDSWSPANGRVVLERAPIQSITSVNYVNTSGTTTLLAADQYVLHTEGQNGGAWIEPAYGLWWPSIRDQSNAVTVDFVAGYGDPEDVPRSIKQAILLLVGHWYEHREDVVVGTITARLPAAVEALLLNARWQVH